MAKKGSTQKKSTSNKAKKTTSLQIQETFYWLLDGRLKKILGVLILVFAVFATVSFISYIFTWQIDQDKVFQSDNLYNYIRNNNKNIANHGGQLGAWLAHQLIFNGFGLPSFLILIFLYVFGLNMLLEHRVFSSLKSLFYNSFFILTLSPILSFIFPTHARIFPYGGAFGNSLIDLLEKNAGTTGTLFIIIGVMIILIIILFNPIFHLRAVQNLFHSNSIIQNQGQFNPPPTVEQIEQSKLQPILTIDENFKLPENESIQDIQVSDPFLTNETKAIPDDFFDSISQPLSSNTEQPTNDYEDNVPVHNNPEIIDLVVEPIITSSDQDATKTINDELPLEVVHHTSDQLEEQMVTSQTIAQDEPYDPSLELRNYRFPTIDLLEERGQENISIDKNELEQNKNQIINTLKSFGIAISKISATVGPTVTLYEIVPAEGVRISKIRNLEDDIALSLSALGIRIIAPIPGKGTIGIEVPNIKKQVVSMRTLINSEKFRNNDFSLPIALGKKIDNENYIVDLATMPHLLMAGATGQGKSVGINTILVSLLYKKHPSQLKFVMVDPKKVELSIYKHIEKHFLAKLPNEDEAIITDTKKVINTLNALCIEMDNRYDLLKEAGVRNIKEYNEKFIKRRLNPNKGHQYLPFIVLVVDEFADLIMTAGKEVEMPIARLAQLARAVGIHLIIATQRPSVNVITGTIKANFPGRIAFRVSAKVDSRTILDTGGADQLIGRGDMLILNGNDLVRLQCAFVDTPEVERIVDFIGNQQGYPTAFDLPEYEGSDGGDFNAGTSTKSLKDVDQMFEQCARLVISSGSGSTSMLQRRFNLGYNRAGRIMDQMEAAGIVGSSIGGKPRELLVHTEMELEEILQQIIK